MCDMDDRESSAKRRFWQKAIAAGLVLNLGLILISFWSALFGPRGFLLFGALGFVVGWCCVFLCSLSDQVKEFLAATPGGLLGANTHSSAPKILERAIRGVTAAALLGIIVLFASARLEGTADFPAFETLPKYELSNHGIRTEVSRLRYAVVSGSFAIGWHSMAALMSLTCLYRLLCGKAPTVFARYAKKKPNTPEANSD